MNNTCFKKHKANAANKEKLHRLCETTAGAKTQSLQRKEVTITNVENAFQFQGVKLSSRRHGTKTHALTKHDRKTERRKN